MRGRKITLILMVLFTVFALVYYQVGDEGAQVVPTIRVSQGELAISLTVSGELEAVDSVVVTAPTVGGSKKLTSLASEGAAVQKGDVVVKFDTTDFEKDLNLAKNDLQVIETKLKQHQAKAERELGQLDSDIAKAKLALERAQLTITDSETVARIEREKARLSAQEAQITEAVLLENRALRESDLQSELRLLSLERQKINEKIRQTQKALDNCTVRAPTSGLVMLAKVWKGDAWGTVEEGDTVWPGRTVLELPDLSKLQVIAQIHELDAALASVGQRATFTLDAIPDGKFTGEIEQIANLAAPIERRSKVKYLRTTLSVNEAETRMKPGMTAKVDIEIETLSNVLSIPREAVFTGEDGPVVYLKNTLGYAAQSVELGQKNATHIVVLEGLKAGDEIALVDPNRNADDDASGEGHEDGA